MRSLRSRLIAAVLALSAAGLVLLAAVTYAEQRSFLQGRVDQQARSAVPAISQRLDSLGYRPPAPGGQAAPEQGAGERHENPFAGGGPGGPHPEAVNLPPGTFGQRLEASRKPLGSPVRIKYSASESIPAAPLLPANFPIERPFTAHSATGDVQYRVFVAHDPEDTGLTAVAVPLTDVDATLHRLLIVEALVIGGVLLALGLTASVVVRLGLRPLTRIEVTAGAIAAGDLSRRVTPAETRTEVGRLGLALNGMLDRLEQAFKERRASEERLRRFLADASHELRTPLASIRGYAELFRMGAARDEDETELAMRRIEEESTRMGVLVEDMLTLARLDEAPEARRARVDLAKLARDAGADAEATAPERPIAVTAPEHAEVWGDPHQLHQVVANLMRNALTHTPAGTPIEVAVQPQDGEVTLSVRDHGPGLPPGPPQQLFDRFWRSEAGRERGRAGAGLGLAIVSEIVTDHGGRIDAANAPGGGAQFTVRLPLSPPRRDPAAPDGALRKL